VFAQGRRKAGYQRCPRSASEAMCSSVAQCCAEGPEGRSAQLVGRSRGPAQRWTDTSAHITAWVQADSDRVASGAPASSSRNCAPSLWREAWLLQVQSPEQVACLSTCTGRAARRADVQSNGLGGVGGRKVQLSQRLLSRRTGAVGRPSSWFEGMCTASAAVSPGWRNGIPVVTPIRVRRPRSGANRLSAAVRSRLCAAIRL